MSVVAVVPIRAADALSEDGKARFQLQGRALWDISLDQALNCKGLSRVVAAYDDDIMLGFLAPWESRGVTLLKRPRELSLKGKTTLDVLRWVMQGLTALGHDVRYGMLLETTHPLRPKGIIDQVAAAISQGESDSMITCHPVHYNFWRSRGDQPVARVPGSGEDVDVAMYQELLGICSAFSAKALAGENPFGERVDIVPIDRFWATIDVRDADGLWLAGTYLNHLGITL